MTGPAPQFPSLHGVRTSVKWAALSVLSVALVVALEMLRIPAALLLGTMAAAILVAMAEGSVRVPQPAFVVAQAIIGCMIARSLAPSLFVEMLKDWPLFVAGVFSVVAASSGLGWLLARFQVLPGSAAIWGSAPGGATAMALLAEAHGADIRLVAFMQYLRVVLVAGVASVVTRIWTAGAPSPHGVNWLPPVEWISFAETMALAALGAFAARFTRIPAGALLLPLATAAFLQGVGAVRIELPPSLLAVTYAVIGWSIGLRFTRSALIHAARALPRIATSIFALIGACGLFAAALTYAAGVDPLTAYLATSPGGADSVAIIAASSHVDLSFVMAMQVARFLVVLFAGPSIARFIAGRIKPGRPADHPL